MANMPRSRLADLAEAQAEMTMSADVRLAIETIAHEMAQEILKEPGVRQELKTLALTAIRQAWQDITDREPRIANGEQRIANGE